MIDSSLASHKARPIRRRLGWALLVIGAGLLLMSMIGEWSSLGDLPTKRARVWEHFDRGLAERTRTLDALYDAAKKKNGGNLRSLPPQQSMQSLFAIASARFTHGAAVHTPLSNWMLWALGRIHPAFGAVRDPGILLKRSASAFCGEVSYVLMQLARKAGIRSRHVGLNGHIVMEAWYDGGWHMYDPDFEVAPLNGAGSVLSVAALSRNEDLIRKAYGGKSGSQLSLDAVVRILTSREDNNFVSYPPGSQFEWKSQILLHFEQSSEYLKFIVPALLIVVGALMLSHRRKYLP